MKYLFLISILFFSLISKGQGVSESQAKSFIDSLKLQGIDTIGIYETRHDALGLDFSPMTKADSIAKDTCIYGLYIQWKKFGKYFITRIESYNTCTEIIPLESSIFFDYFFKYKNQIKRDTIKLSTYISVVNGVKTEITQGVCDDNYIQELTMIVNNRKIYKTIDKFDIYNNAVYGISNQKTKLWKWDVLTEEQIRNLIKQGGFRKKIKYPVHNTL